MLQYLFYEENRRIFSLHCYAMGLISKHFICQLYYASTGKTQNCVLAMNVVNQNTNAASTWRIHVQTIPIMSVKSPIFIYTAIARIWGKQLFSENCLNGHCYCCCFYYNNCSLIIVIIVLFKF